MALLALASSALLALSFSSMVLLAHSTLLTFEELLRPSVLSGKTVSETPHDLSNVTFHATFNVEEYQTMALLGLASTALLALSLALLAPSVLPSRLTSRRT
jgi:hypothetical protein